MNKVDVIYYVNCLKMAMGDARRPKTTLFRRSTFDLYQLAIITNKDNCNKKLIQNLGQFLQHLSTKKRISCINVNRYLDDILNSLEG